MIIEKTSDTSDLQRCSENEYEVELIKYTMHILTDSRLKITRISHVIEL